MQCDLIDKIINENKSVHLIGVGGISMSGIASILLGKGCCVSGSDIQENEFTTQLKKLGCEIYTNHSSDNITDDTGLVVYTFAVDKNNEEIKEALKRKIPVINRAEFLGIVTNIYDKCVTVSGTHGKTTTTSMFTYVMMYNELDPTVLLGGDLSIMQGNFRVGKSDYLLMEACEYKESFLKFSTNIGVILNIDKDHLDYYRDLDHIKETFTKYANSIPKDGCLIVCADDLNISDVLKNVKCKVVSYGIEQGDFRAFNIRNGKDFKKVFDLKYNGKIYKDIEIKAFGEHNILNALATICFSFVYNLDFEKTKKALSEFQSPKKRFEIRGKKNNITLVEDYAHHPTEIRATIKAAKGLTDKKIFCFFQPHTYSRTLSLFDEFSQCFDGVEELILLDIYAAREKDLGSVSSFSLGEKIRDLGQKCYNAKDFNDALYYAKNRMKDGDIFLTVGAGNVGSLCDMFINL